MTDLDETNVCYLCETVHDCAEGNEVKALSGEWVCLSCQDKLISELAPKIKADAVEGYHSELAPRWISVEDELPEPISEELWHTSREVLLYSEKHGVIKAVLNGYGVWSSADVAGDGIVEDGTIWMSMPTPPKANKLEGGE